MFNSEDFAREARENFRSVADYTVADAQLRRFRYHLLRLTATELSREDIPNLVELGRLAFQGADVAGQADAIKQRPGVSELAAAIAGIAAEGGRVGDRGAALLGAVLGAYISLIGAGANIPENDRKAAAILGAIAGATALSTGTFILDNLEKQGSADYFRSEADHHE